MSQGDVDTLMRWQHANICSDGDLKDGHPRGRGAFPRVLADYVRERHVLTLEQAIHKMTLLSGRHIGIRIAGSSRRAHMRIWFCSTRTPSRIRRP